MTELSDGLRATEAECAEGRTAPRVSLDDIVANIGARYDFTAGAAVDALGMPGHTALPLLSICILVTMNGFVLIGKSAPASAANFDADLGRKLAYEDAVRQLWPLMGYELRERLTRQTVTTDGEELRARFDHERPIGSGKFRKVATVNAIEAAEVETMPTKWGDQTAQVGDFIVTNPDGERYPVSRETFLSTYEPAQ